jgi:hypothetical protein
MDITLARQLANQLVEALADAAPAPTTVPISTPDALDRAISAANGGATIVLDPTLVYNAPLVLDKPLWLVGPMSGSGRVPVDAQLPRLRGGVRLNKGGALFGLEVSMAQDPHNNIIEGYGTWTIDRCRVLGDGANGAKRGLAAFPRGSCFLARSIVDDCFQASPGSDSQAVAMWEGGGLTIDDCFLRGGSETVMLGGADSPSPELMPSDVIFRNSVITKRPEWMSKPVGVKNALELKACRRVLIENCDIQYSWAQGQVGYLLTLTVRNQDGKAPWSTIEDVTIQNNRLAHGASALSILGIDYLQPSGRMARVKILNNVFTDLDPVKYRNGAFATDKLMMIQGGDDITIDNNEFHMTQCSSQVYFDWSGADRQQMKNLRITNNRWPTSLYGVFGSEGSVNKSFPFFVDGGELSNNTTIV